MTSPDGRRRESFADYYDHLVHDRLFRWIDRRKVAVIRRSSDHISPFTRESLAWAMGRRFSDVRIGTVNLGLSMYAVAVK